MRKLNLGLINAKKAKWLSGKALQIAVKRPFMLLEWKTSGPLVNCDLESHFFEPYNADS